MSTKYIRPNNLLSDRKTSELIKKKKYISEDEYEAKYAFIESLLNDLDLNIEDAESITEEELNQFKSAEKNVDDNIEWLMGYIDEIYHNDKFDLDQKKAKIRDYISEKYNISKFKNINRIIEQRMKEKYIDYKNEIKDEIISDENNNQYILKKVKNINRNKVYDNLIYKITSNDSLVIEDNNENLIYNINTDLIEENKNVKDFTNKNILFYNDNAGIKIVSLAKTCSKISFRYKTYNNSKIYFYIDGEYYSKYDDSNDINITVDQGLHVFTWVLYCKDTTYIYSYIDEIAIDDVIITDYNEFNISNNSLPLGLIPNDNQTQYFCDSSIDSTPFYNNTEGIKIVSLTETCSKISFRYKTYTDNNTYSTIYLYIDGKYYNKYIYDIWAIMPDITVPTGLHEFTWVLYNYNNNCYSCIDQITIDDVIITDYSEFNNNISNELINNSSNSLYKYDSSIDSTPFYNNIYDFIKIVSLTETCSKISFRYKTYGNYNHIYLYIDNEYKDLYNNYNNDWQSENITVDQGLHVFTWVLYSSSSSSYNSYYSCIDEIAIDDVTITDYSKFKTRIINNINIKTNNLLSTYIKENYNNYNSVSFYNDREGIKIVSFTETCSKISFKYQIYDESSNNVKILLYIDGEFKKVYYDTSKPLTGSARKEILWQSENITVDQGLHVFTWVLCCKKSGIRYYIDQYINYYSCIDEIAIDDTIITDYSKFNNNISNELINPIEYKYNTSIESTPFYNDAIGIKMVSLTETCSKISFRYKTYSTYNYIYLYIDGKYHNNYSYQNTDWCSSGDISVSTGLHEFTWVLYSHDNFGYSCIDEIAIDDVIITEYSKFNNNNNISNELTNNFYKYDTSIESTPFYNDTTGNIKIVTLTETCSKISFRYKTYNTYSHIYLYIDGIKYSSNYTYQNNWGFEDITVPTGLHEFTWVLYRYSDNHFSCIDEIAIDDVIITNYSKFNNNISNELKNSIDYKYNIFIESTPFYNDTEGIKIISLSETCSKISFRYKFYGSYNHIYLYIDGVHYRSYNDTNSDNWSSSGDITVDQGLHVFTWVLYSYSNYQYTYIDEIAIDDVIITNYSEFNISNNSLPLGSMVNNNGYILNNSINYKYNSSIESTPFYNDKAGIKIVSFTETCSKISFRYKTYNSDSRILLYIDGKYYRGDYYSYNNWSSSGDITVSTGLHEFTWVIYCNDYYSYSCIDEIAIDDTIITEYSKFNNNNYNLPLGLIPNNNQSKYKYNTSIESTPFYNDVPGFKIITLTETCSKISFRYKTYESSVFYNCIYLYIDGEYKNSYSSQGYQSSDDITVSTGLHEFTWVLYSTRVGYYSCIDEITIDDVIITNYSKFNNTEYNLPSGLIPNNNQNEYKYNTSIESTPFYNDTRGIKIVSFTETCSKINFKYKTYGSDVLNNSIYLYIDGKYHNNYSQNTDWRSSGDISVSTGLHEFTWILYSYTNNYYSCIDEIAIDDVIITEYSKFNNNISNELTSNFYKYNKSIESTPFYNDTRGIKIVSFTETCSKISFSYKTYNSDSNILLYIDGKYYKNYYYSSWHSSGDIIVSTGLHEFTWVLYCEYDTYYSCIDQITIDDVIITDYNEFNNNISNELINNNYILQIYKYNSSIESTPFYNDKECIKIVTLTETCSKISFKYRTYTSRVEYNSIYLYIDGEYYNKYNSDNWRSSGDIIVSTGLHEFTWVLFVQYNHSNGTYKTYSCIDEITIDDVIITDYNEFNNNISNELINNNYILQIYKYNSSIESTPFYNDKEGAKTVSFTETCSKISFRYKTCTNYGDDNSIYLYIDGEYENRYTSNNWHFISDITVSPGLHEFTFVLYCIDDSRYTYIDEIAIDDTIITEYSKFNNNNYNLPLGLGLIPNNNQSKYKYNTSIESTPFYNNTEGIKIVSLTETCSKISFRYRTFGSYNKIYLYIDGKYYSGYNNGSWSSSSDITVSTGLHEFTWVLYCYMNTYYSYIDEIAIDDVIITEYSKFNNINNYELINHTNYKYNSSIESTPFYNDRIGVKIVTLTETCSKISFRYRNRDYSSIFFYIDSEYYSNYDNIINDEWSSSGDITVSPGLHEFTWVLYNAGYNSCIDEITIDDVIITEYSKFNNNISNELNSLDDIYKNYFIYEYNIKINTLDFTYTGDVYLSINNKIIHIKNSNPGRYIINDGYGINSIKIYSENEIIINGIFSLDFININFNQENIYNFISLNEKIEYNKIYKINPALINIKNTNNIVNNDEYICLDSNMNIIFSTLYPPSLKDFINNKIEKNNIYLLIYSKNKNGYINNNIEFEKINFITKLILFSNNENKIMKLFNGDVYQKIKINNKNELQNINDYNFENIEL